MVHRFIIAALLTVVGVLPATVSANGSSAAPVVTVSEEKGLYTVTAQFDVPQGQAAVLAVLTDYEGIPRFMPGITSSAVRQRTATGAVVEQEAVSRFMFFSKRVHLVLEIEEGAESLRFSDRCGKSFARYDGRWRVSTSEGRTQVVYELTAQPSFEVPEFILKRLLKRDSGEMIEHLRREIAARDGQAPSSSR